MSLVMIVDLSISNSWTMDINIRESLYSSVKGLRHTISIRYGTDCWRGFQNSLYGLKKRGECFCPCSFLDMSMHGCTVDLYVPLESRTSSTIVVRCCSRTKTATNNRSYTNYNLCIPIRKPPPCVYIYIRTFKIYLRISVFAYISCVYLSLPHRWVDMKKKIKMALIPKKERIPGILHSRDTCRIPAGIQEEG